MIALVTGAIGLLVAIVIIVLMRKDRLHASHGLAWVAVAIGFALLGFTPGIIDFVAKALGVAYPPVLALTLAIAILVVKIYQRLTPRQIASYSFMVVAAGAFWLAFVVNNNWSTLPVLLGLISFGIGQGALVTLLFNVLVTSSPKELAADVGALRGTASNLAASVGTAVMGTLVVAVLSAGVMSSLTAYPVITPDLKQQVDLDSIIFLSNVLLEVRLKGTTATPEQITEALRINEDARLRALKVAFFALGCLSTLAVFPSRKLPDYRPGEVPPDGKLNKA